MTASAIVQVEGHIVDSLILAKILDVIVESGAEYRLLEIEVGKSHTDPSYARIEITTETEGALEGLLADLLPHGAHLVDEPNAKVAEVTQDGVLPRGFYATTNLPTSVKIDGRWIE